MTTRQSHLRLTTVVLVSLAAQLAACTPTSSTHTSVSAAEAQAIGDSLRSMVRAAYDLSPGDVPARMLSLYPSTGTVVSAAGGRVTTTRDSLGLAVRAFWDGVGQFMVRPTWTWGDMRVEVIARDAAVLTAQYTVPHWTDQGRPHVIGGVWTSVWQRRDGRWLVTHEHLSDLPRGAAEAIEATMPEITATADSTPPDSAHRH